MSLRQGPGHWDETARDHELGEQHLNGLLNFFKQLYVHAAFLPIFPGSIQASPGVDRLFFFRIGLVENLGAYKVAHCPRGKNSFEDWATEFYGITVCCAIFGEIN